MRSQVKGTDSPPKNPKWSITIPAVSCPITVAMLVAMTPMRGTATTVKNK